MEWIYQDSNWGVIEKPSGISTHGAFEGDLGLVEWLRLHHGVDVRICSRLDKGTSGCILFARNSSSVARAQKYHRDGQTRKVYCFLAAHSTRSSWVCTDSLDGKACATTFTAVAKGNRYGMYKAVIRNGRKHQIRRHAAASGIPLLGDDTYGGEWFYRLCLHCAELKWPEIPQLLRSEPPEWFADCLDGVQVKHIGKILAGKREPLLRWVGECFRLIHRGAYPEEDIAIDKYGEWLCVTGFDESLSAKKLLQRINPLVEGIVLAYGSRGGVVKTNVRDPHKRKLFADIASFGEGVPESFFVHEHGFRFGVRLNKKQHVGLFLDHRDSRQRIAEQCKGKRVANLFAFTCSFSVYALAAGAEVVFSVDLAAGCLQIGKDNVAGNGLGDVGNAKFIQEDVRKWLARQVRKKRKDPDTFSFFDVVICDPPVFAAAKKGQSFHVEREWPELARMVSEIMTPNGVALFSNNHQAGQELFYYTALKKRFSSVSRLSSPLDFPKQSGQAPHVRIYWCVK